MKKHIILLLLNFILTTSFSQVQSSRPGNIWIAKEFSKDVALFNSKNFLFSNVFGSSSEIVQFEVIPLAAASSGELTTLLYKCDSKQKEGIVLGFYGNYWNDAGVVYQGFDFKNLEKQKAYEFLNKIEDAIESNSKFLKKDADNNNIFFSYEDIDVLIYASSQTYTIRLFWKQFDSSWENTAFERSKRRFQKRTK